MKRGPADLNEIRQVRFNPGGSELDTQLQAKDGIDREGFANLGGNSAGLGWSGADIMGTTIAEVSSKNEDTSVSHRVSIIPSNVPIESEIVTENEMDIWDMLEKQALAASEASRAPSLDAAICTQSVLMAGEGCGEVFSDKTSSNSEFKNNSNISSDSISICTNIGTYSSSGASRTSSGISIDSNSHLSSSSISDPSLDASDVLCVRLEVVSLEIDSQRFVKVVKARRTVRSSGSGLISPRISNDIYMLELRHEWFNTELSVGNIIHVIDMCKYDLMSQEKSNSKDTSPQHGLRRAVFPSNVIIDRDNYLLIVNPDCLLSPSTISEVKCTRRAVLAEKFKSFGSASVPGTLGALRHRLIEELTKLAVDKYRMMDETTKCSIIVDSNVDIFNVIGITARDVDNAIDSIYYSSIVEMASAGIAEEDVKLILVCLIPAIKDWISHLIRSFKFPKAPSNKIDCGDVPGIEESIWSPVLGLKGQIDLLGSAFVASSTSGTSANKGRGVSSSNDSQDGIYIPIEIKTGKKKASVYSQHRAQVIFYILMLLMREKSLCYLDYIDDSNDSIGGYTAPSRTRLQSPITNYMKGYLVYISEDDREVSIDAINPTWIEIVALLINRNSVGFFSDNVVQNDVFMKITENSTTLEEVDKAFNSNFPEILRSKHDCEFCFQSAECMVTFAAIDNGNEESSGVSELYQFVIGDISKNQLDYFKNWDRLINLESMEVNAWQNKIWSCSSRLLESMDGDCVGGLRARVSPGIGSVSKAEGKDIDGEKGLRLTFELADEARSYSGGLIDKGTGRAINSFDENSPLTSTLSTDSSSTDGAEMRNLKRFGFQIGDYVHISLENIYPSRIHSKGMINKRNSDGNLSRRSSYDSLEDIENIGLNRNKTQYFEDISIGHVQPNVGAGYISDVKAESIEVSVMHMSYQLKSFLNSKDRFFPNSKHLFIRLDKNNSPVFLRTLRSNLISLYTGCVNTFNFRKMKLNYNSVIQNRTSAVTDIDNTSFIPDNRDRSKRLRELIIDLRKPTVTISDHILSRVPSDRSDVINYYNSLNLGQSRFINQLSCADDYVLLQGLPGTGKTSIVALAAALLLLSGKRILLTSYTHSAIDNILMKIKEYGFGSDKILRIGNANDIHPKVMMYHFDPKTSTSIDEIKNKFESAQLVACTVLAASRDIMQSFKSKFDLFDWCIVDEAGQILQPAIFEALGLALKFILSGDCQQLSPLVKSDEAKRRGMDVSLFSRLATAHPAAVFTLTEQYRMNSEIMAISNRLIYNNQMNCGLESTANAKFILPEINKIPRCLGATDAIRDDWLFKCLSPNFPVIFLNTDKIDELRDIAINNQCSDDSSSKSSRVQINRSNSLEAYVVYMLVASLKRCMFKMSELGVISVYRSQVKAIETLLSARGVFTGLLEQDKTPKTNNNNDQLYSDSSIGSGNELVDEVRQDQCEISTVDKFQGRDMEMIIFSSVQGKNSEVGNLLIDRRRINVAMTRAKTKFIIIGSIELMRKDGLLANLVDLSIEKNWIINLETDKISNYYEGF